MNMISAFTKCLRPYCDADMNFYNRPITGTTEPVNQLPQSDRTGMVREATKAVSIHILMLPARLVANPSLARELISSICGLFLHAMHGQRVVSITNRGSLLF